MDQAIINIVYWENGYGMAVYVLITTLIAGAISSVIGIERETHGQAAGLRTHVLLSVGCCLLMTISIWAIGLATGQIDLSSGGVDKTINYDSSRIAAGIIAGIGFLCGGTIMKTGFSIKGLTTAATLWICAAIGMACGCGFILEAIVAGTVTFLFLIGLVYVEKFMDKKSPSVTLIVANNYPIVQDIRKKAEDNRLVIKNIDTEEIEASDQTTSQSVRVYFAFKSDIGAINDFCDSFANNSKVYSIRTTRFEKRY